MNQSQSSHNLAVVSVIGAISSLLWLPLLPILLPIVSLFMAIKWAFVRAPSKHLSSPTTPFSQSQAKHKTAWPSSASLPYPAGAGSLPFSSKVSRDTKSLKRQEREYRQVARVMKGLDLRKSALSY